MSSFLCFVCHSTVNADTNEETREKYREVIGMNLCPDSHLCYICCYFLNKMCMFKSICLKRTLEYPVLFSEKGTINLQRSLTTVSILCPEDLCLQHLNTRYHFYNDNENSQSDFDDTNYCELQDDRNFDLNDNQSQWNDTLLKSGALDHFHSEDYLFVTKDSVVDNLFNEELMIPNIEPVRITQNDLVNGKWTENVYKSEKHNTLLELNSRSDFDRIICPVMSVANPSQQIAVNNISIQQNLNIIGNNRAINFFNDKSQHLSSCNLEQNYQNMPLQVPSINYNTKSCYEQLDNHVNEGIENNIYVNRHSCSINEGKLNESVNKVKESVDSVNVSEINRGETITDTIETVKPSDQLQSNINEINESISNANQCVKTTDAEHAVIYETTENVNDKHTNELESNTQEHVDDIKDSANLNETDMNINEDEQTETEMNIIENEQTEIEMNINENQTEYNNDTSIEVETPSDSDSQNIDKLEQKKSKKKKKKKDLYEKIYLTLEEQKAELEKARKEEKYLTAAFKCHSCAMYFHFKDTYQTHMMRHEESNGEHSCSICSLRFANPGVVRSHRANHSVRYACALCGARVRARQRDTHARACAGDRDSLACHLCGRTFTCSEYLQQHMQKYHGAQSAKTYLCNVCGRRFSTRARVRTHMITHINQKFTCDRCPSTFSSPYTLNQHKKTRHECPELSVHPCSTCNVTFSTRKSLLAHLRNALPHKDTLHKCGECARGCSSAAALARHTASVHARTNHLACTMCHKHYSTQKSLVKHMSTNHKEGKPVPLCHACGMTFKSTTILKKHLKNVCEKDRKCQNVMEDELLQVPYFG